MNSKIIYAKTKEAFQRELPNFPDKLDPLVFIEDTSQIWILGKYFSMGTPTVMVSEKNNVVDIKIGEEGFNLSTTGETISIIKGVGNNIIFSSSALNTIDTSYPLKWDAAEKKLSHVESLLEGGSFGTSTSIENASFFTIPWFVLNKWGHITEVQDRDIKIRDYVEQVPTTNTKGDYNILVANSSGELSETNITRKAIGLSYDPEEKKLSILGGINAGPSKIQGDFTVVGGNIIGNVDGDVTGTATPKIHLSKDPEYGGASKNLYGHVKLEDTLGVAAPAPSSDIEDDSSSEIIRGVAASPRMVWDVREELREGIDAVQKGVDALPIITTIKVNDVDIEVENLGGTLGVRVGGGMSAGVDVNNNIVLTSTTLRGYDNEENMTEVKSNIEFTKDFEFIEDKLSLRWTNIIE